MQYNYDFLCRPSGHGLLLIMFRNIDNNIQILTKLKLPKIRWLPLSLALVATLFAVFCHPNCKLLTTAICVLSPLRTFCVLVVTITNKAALWAIHLHPRRIFLALVSCRPSFAVYSVVYVLAGANFTALLAVFSHPRCLLFALTKVRPKLTVP